MDTQSLIPCLPKIKVLQRVSILAETLDYNHKLMNIPSMWSRTMGRNVTVAILDTGRPNHVDLQPNGHKSFIPGYDEDFNGHATHCGGIIAAVANNGMGVAGIAPNVTDVYGAVLGHNGSGSIDSIVKGIYWAVDEAGADIISMSLGIAAGYPIFPGLEQACNYAVSQGVAVFAAAGNEAGKVGQPAIYDSVIAVAAVDNWKSHADFSNTGPEIDFAAGGVNVYSTYLGNGYAKLSGTSMACPALAGVAALIKSDHRNNGIELSPTELKAHLKKIAYDVGPEGFDTTFGWGIPIFQKNIDPPSNITPDTPDTPLNPDTPPSEPSNPDVKAKGRIDPNCATWRLVHRYVNKFNHELEFNPIDVALKNTLAELQVEINKIDSKLKSTK